MKLSPLSVLVVALTFYCLGATFFESFVNYRTWRTIDGESFSRYHATLTPLVVRVMLIPIALYFVSSPALLVWTPPELTRKALTASVMLQAIAIASSIIVQVPIQMQLRQLGPVDALLDRLIWTDLVLRKAPLALNAGLWLSMLGRT